MTDGRGGVTTGKQEFISADRLGSIASDTVLFLPGKSFGLSRPETSGSHKGAGRRRKKGQ